MPETREETRVCFVKKQSAVCGYATLGGCQKSGLYCESKVGWAANSSPEKGWCLGIKSNHTFKHNSTHELQT